MGKRVSFCEGAHSPGKGRSGILKKLCRRRASCEPTGWKVRAVVLAGGEERGFAPLTRECPKALLPLANASLLSYTLGYLAREGIQDVFVCINEGAHSIRDRIPDGRPWGISLRYATERTPLGTAGCLRDLQPLLGGEPFVVVAGLPFLDFPLRKLVAAHREREATITVALTDGQLASGFAERVVLGDDGVVEEIVSPYGRAVGTSTRTLGVYIVDPRVFEFVGRESYLDLKEQLIPRLQRAGLPVVATQVPGVGVRLDTLTSYLHFSRRFLGNGFMGNGNGHPERFIRLGVGVSVSRSARLQGPLLVGNRSTISARTRVEGPTAIGAACILQPGSVVVASVLMEGAQVSEGVHLERCVVAPGCQVPRGKAFADHLLLDSNHHAQASLKAVHLDGQRARRQWLLQAMKRTLDLVLGTLGLVVGAPALMVAALAITLDSPGPVLFRQRRAGRGGGEFTMVKLRTMFRDAEALQGDLADRNEVDGPMFKIGNDPRITRVGRFLRRTKLDELPQLLNVIRGEMSLVGPRPLAMKEMQYNPAWRDLRLSVKPGITGLWQVESGRKNTFQDWIAADLRYVEEQSLLLDLRILAETAREVWRSLRA